MGEVLVIDGGKNITLAGGAFSGATYNAATAGNYPHVALVNPAGSGKNAVINCLMYAVDANGTVVFKSGAGTLGAEVRKAGNKLAGAANSLSSVNFLQQSSIAGGVEMFTSRINTGQLAIQRMVEPVVVPPGHYFCAVNTAVATALAMSFEFREENI